MRIDGTPLPPWRLLGAPPGRPLPLDATADLAARLQRHLPPPSDTPETVVVDDGLAMVWLGTAERLADHRPGRLARLLGALLLPHDGPADGAARLQYALRNWDAVALVGATLRSLSTPRPRRQARFCELAGPVAERALTLGPVDGVVVPVLFPDEAAAVSAWLEFLLCRPTALVRVHDRVGVDASAEVVLHPRVLGRSPGALPAEVIERALQEHGARSAGTPLVGVVRADG